MNNQQAFDLMVTHLRNQKLRSAIYDGHNRYCVYRSPDGLKCAVGVLIPDEFYDSNLEGQPASSLTNLIPFLQNVDKYFLDKMQEIHDFRSPNNWEEAFEDIAFEYDLKIPK